MNCFFSMFAALALVHQGKAESTEGIICDPEGPPTIPSPLDPSEVGAFINEVSLKGTGCPALGYYVEVATSIKATLVLEVYNAVLDCTATTTSTTSTDGAVTTTTDGAVTTTTDGAVTTTTDGGATSADGGATSADGGATSADGGATSADGGATSADGGATSADGGATSADGSTGAMDFEADCTGNPERLFQFTFPAHDIVDGSIYVFNFTTQAVVGAPPEAITYRLYAVDGQYSCQVTHLFTVGTNEPSAIDGIKPSIIVDDTAVGDKWIYGATGTGWYLGDFNYTKFDDDVECTMGMANAGQTFDIRTETTTTTQGLPSSGFSVMGNNLIIMGLMTLVGMA